MLLCHFMPLPFSLPRSLSLWAAKKWIDEMTAFLSFSRSLTPSRDAAKCGKEMHKGSFLPQGKGGGALALVGQDSILSAFSLLVPILFLPLDSFLHRGKFNTALRRARPRGQSLWQPLRFILPPSRDSRLTSRTGASITSWSSRLKTEKTAKTKERGGGGGGVGLRAQEEEERERG